MAIGNDEGLPGDPSRRSFLRVSGGLVGGSWLALQWPGLLAIAEAAAADHSARAAFRYIGMEEAAGLEAIAARIIPTDDTPGAREAGVIHFIDRALGEFVAEAAANVRVGLADLDGRAAALEDGRRFAQLDALSQDALLREIEATPFFGLMHFLTVAGMFAMPSYGGNRDMLGWRLLGFDHRHGWSPPFGHYDGLQSGSPAPATGEEGEHGHG
jgi:gluconate 2-dehydrogenase gamma chain